MHALFFEDYDISPAQFDLLSQVAAEPGLSQQALADRLLVTKGNVCGLLDRMERDGLVERRRDEEDRRINQVHATDKGRSLFDGSAPALE
ncbi:MAG: MarR family transcriptional regulator, partial [Desulfuromonadales bacterium]|nr:MarR family transcriptional regulator [Desulfuromonadales bacterium]